MFDESSTMVRQCHEVEYGHTLPYVRRYLTVTQIVVKSSGYFYLSVALQPLWTLIAFSVS
jgi:hypothetical protein